MYQSDFINSILTDKKNSIVKMLQKYNPQNIGGLYTCTCPIDNIGTMVLDHRNNTWYCSHCGESGNIISLVMRLKDYSFDDAVKFLAVRAGIEIPEIEEEIEDNSVFYEINKAAAGYFFHDFHETPGFKYLTDRGIDYNTKLNFALGFASKTPGLYDYLKGLGYKDSQLLKSGLIGLDSKARYYEKFKNRVMYPIFDVDGRIIGFGGRVLDDSKPKYLNSPATPVFDKKKNLYGLNIAKNTKEKYFICCEGYMDVISMHQAGFNNAVASLGTALTKEQVSLMSNYVDTIYLAYDSDAPGQSAALRAIKLCEQEGLNCSIINMSPCKDPDEFIKKFGKDEFLKRIHQSEKSGHFTVRMLRAKYGETPEFYDEAIKLLLKKEENN